MQQSNQVCFYCEDTAVLGVQESIATLKKAYGIVRPICQTCCSSGKKPVTRNALRVKKNINFTDTFVINLVSIIIILYSALTPSSEILIQCITI